MRLLASPFYLSATKRGDIVESTVQESAHEFVLIHPRVRIPSYPWEWTSSQWLAAAELTLSLCDEALDEGWILKDATPLNILFIGSRPVLVDVLSFERRDPASSLWLAYGQYVRTFLLPLLMKRLLNWPLELSLFKRDGYEPSELYTALRWPQRLSRSALWQITLPALLDRRKYGVESAARALQSGQDPELTLSTLKRTIAGLRKRTRAALTGKVHSEWSGYTDTLAHYTSAESNKA
jgi:hypothetical protein